MIFFIKNPNLEKNYFRGGEWEGWLGFTMNPNYFFFGRGGGLAGVGI